MLKRLELVGFKSFADKTRFDFAPGVTAIVGPNGSGKSNVVDAVKWVLGEQSAKSLRGGEMADVIFNGSATRKSLGLAEVTMTFDNARRHLRFDTDDVQVTRRVYRDGQGEYLINGTLARLKDVKDLFLGTGAGTGTYCIIEQGRVDALLTASAKDRRLLFEEAAGVSRFRAKKMEALRKLDHTNQNLNRVRDILQELEKNLRVLSAQAAKAKVYQEYTARLRELRLGLAGKEFAELSAALAEHEAALGGMRTELTEAAVRAADGEAAAKALDAELNRADDGVRHQERRLADARQRIMEGETAARSNRERADGFTAELLRIGQQRAAVGARVRGLEAESAKTKADTTAAADSAAAAQIQADSAASALAAVTAAIAETNRRLHADRDEQFELVQRSARSHAAAGREREAIDRLRKELDRKRAEATRSTAEADATGRALADVSASDADVQQRLADARRAVAGLQHEQAELRRRADALQPDLEASRDRRSALRGRTDVLEGLERSLEGVGAGVRAVLANPHPAVIGLVADLLTVPRDVAPLVDVALGDAAQRVVVRDVDAVLAGLGPLPGRVGFVPVPMLAPPLRLGEGAGGVRSNPSPGDALDPSPKLRGEQSLAALVRSDLPGLPEHLLGNVLLADDLPAARYLSSHHPTCRVITRAGELLDPDGTVTVGPVHAEGSLLSRKSELRDLRTEAVTLDAAINAVESEQFDLRRRADALDPAVLHRETEIAALADTAGDLRDRIVRLSEKRDRLLEQVELVVSESAVLTGELDHAESAAARASTEALEADAAAAAVKLRLDAAEAELRSADAEKAVRQAADTDARVALGRAVQTRDSLAARGRELDDDLRRRKYDAFNLLQDEKAARDRRTDADLSALRAEQTAADSYREKEARQKLAGEWAARQSAVRAERDRVTAELAADRDARQAHQSAAHERELAARDLRARRDAVAARVREDYGVELHDAPSQAVPENAAAEMDDLKRKLAKLGSVNLEALEQLTTEEAREKQIRSEFDDLTAAEKGLLEIIEQINIDSRRLFDETLATVRGHFQELFRKLFGGGQADVILDDPADPLESGIEITARPPGKELRSISLMSGGEKTLTAVALLLAVFRSKPSPFCLLDEVDAALDEANTGRLAGALREFLDRSQFIVITHKKRTMAAADILFGVTMQESGISKQVAARLDDWPEEPAQAA